MNDLLYRNNQHSTVVKEEASNFLTVRFKK